MKKMIFMLLFVFLCSLSVCASDLPENVYNASSLQIHMRQQFYYANDRVIPDYFEYFQMPPILEFSRVGDCDDFSIYSNYYLYLMGYDTHQFILILLNIRQLNFWFIPLIL